MERFAILQAVSTIIKLYSLTVTFLRPILNLQKKIQDLVDLLMKVTARPDIPFYLYTTPPKERIKDATKDFYSAGFAPGAIVYFSYDLPNGSELNTEEIKQAHISEKIFDL